MDLRDYENKLERRICLHQFQEVDIRTVHANINSLDCCIKCLAWHNGHYTTLGKCQMLQHKKIYLSVHCVLQSQKYATEFYEQ